MQNSLWLIFDLGTSGVKAALMTDTGEIVNTAVQSYPTHTGEGSIVEQDAENWWDATLAACQVLAADFSSVKAIALTGQMQDILLVNGDHRPVRPVILYSDTRAQKQAATVQQIGTRLRFLTGNDQAADSLLAKLLWLRQNEPDSLQKAKFLLCGAADYLALQLTGTAVTDTTTASTTGLMDLHNRVWLEQAVFDGLGIGMVTRLLPPLSAGGTQIGTLTSQAAHLLHLQPGLPVYHGPGDAGAATIGAGGGEMGRAYLYLGTSGWVAFTSAEPGSPAQGVITLAHPRPDRYIPVAPLLTAGGNLEWVMSLFSTDDYTTLITEALARPVSDILYLPYLNGERSPFSDPLARAAFIGMGRGTTQADLCRAVLEGVVYAYRHALDALLSSRPDLLLLTGGGTRSEGWCQLFADVSGIPIAISGDAENVGVRGALFAAQGYPPDSTFPVKTTLHPNRSTHYEKKYAMFRTAYPALKPIFAGLAHG